MRFFTQRYRAMLLLAAMFGAACVFDAAAQGKDGGKLLRGIIDGSSGAVTKFEYDGQSRISKIHSPASVSSITYTDNLITVKEGGGKTSKFAINGATVTVGTETLLLNKDGYLIRRKDSGRTGLYENKADKDGEFVEGVYVEKYQYKDGNLTMEEDNLGDPCCFKGSYRRFEYDNKPGPFSGCKSPKWLIQYLIESSAASKNNTVEKTSGGGDYYMEYVYTFEYGSDGFPAKQTKELKLGEGQDNISGEELITVTHFFYTDAELFKAAAEFATAAKAAAEAAAKAAAEAAVAAQAAADAEAARAALAPQISSVSNVKEFIAALGPNKIIELKPGKYHLPDGVKTNSEGAPLNPAKGVSWSSVKGGLVFNGISNLIIRAAGGKLPELIIDEVEDYVLSFVNCRNIVISGIKAGHSVGGGSCTGGVFHFENSAGIYIADAAMYGSGTEGLTLRNVSGMKVTNSRIYECTYAIMTVFYDGDVFLENCTFDDNKVSSDLVNVYHGAPRLSFTDCTFKNNTGGRMFDVMDGIKVSVSRSVFSGNKVTGIIANSPNVSFSGCEFKNNTVVKK